MSGFRARLAAHELAWQDRFLLPRTCTRLREELEFALWRPSRVATRQGRLLLHQQSNARVSESASEEWFSEPLRRALRGIERRLVRLLERPAERFEAWQATRYAVGGRFNFHHDGGQWHGDSAGEREMTVLLCLEEPASGGSTRFGELGIAVEARAGRLLVWNNMHPDGSANPRMLHASMPVRRGKKCVLVTWIRQRAIRRADRSREATAGGPHGQ
jgi:prolyl 4-hydroxylase